ncbi:hypothetical protein [Streptomyces sp. NPDC053367]|uniref:hypothetical protein n=1 Tax=Streptomyces sp. NPDC053367 TaxID=3365700 RepID=UPI0037D78E2A
MNVEIDPLVRNAAAELGAGVPYALKAVTGWLTDDPDIGEPSGLPGVLTVRIDGDMIEDCPALAIGYVRGPDRIDRSAIPCSMRSMRSMMRTPTAPAPQPPVGPRPSASGRPKARRSA